MVHEDPAVNLFQARYSNVHLLTHASPFSATSVTSARSLPREASFSPVRHTVYLTIYTVLVVSPDSANE